MAISFILKGRFESKPQLKDLGEGEEGGEGIGRAVERRHGEKSTYRRGMTLQMALSYHTVQYLTGSCYKQGLMGRWKTAAQPKVCKLYFQLKGESALCPNDQLAIRILVSTCTYIFLPKATIYTFENNKLCMLLL